MMDEKQMLEDLKKNPTEHLLFISEMLIILEGAKEKGITTVDEVITNLKLLATELEEADR